MFGKTLVTLHVVGAILSIVLLVSTFLAKGVITSKAKQHAVEKSRGYADSLAGKLQDTLDGPVTGGLVRGKVRERLEAELSGYQASPDAWLTRLAEGGADRAKDFDFPEVQQPLARKALDALAKQVANLKGHLEGSYQDLILDLRIFAGTNLAAFLFATWLSTKSRTPRSRFWLLAFSSILLVAAGFSTLVYVDQNWTWSILTRSYFGWGYPALLGIVASYLLFKVAPSLSDSQPVPEKTP